MDVSNYFIAPNTTLTSGSAFVHSGIVRAVGEGLILTVFYENDFGAPDNITSVVWDVAGDNQAFTEIQHQYLLDGSHRSWAQFALPAPTSAKTADITITFAGTSNNRIASYGVKTDSAFTVNASAVFGHASAPNTTYTHSVTSAVGDLCLSFAAFPTVAGGVSPTGTGVTSIAYASPHTSRMVGGAKEQATTTSTSFGWYVDPSITPPYDLGIFLVSLTPGGGGAVVTGSNSQQSNQSSAASVSAAALTGPAPANSQQVNQSSTASVSVPAAVGTITIPIFNNWNTGNAAKGETGVTVFVNDVTTGALVVKKTAQTTDATTGVCVVTDALIIPGTTYRATTVLSNGTTEGTWRYLAT